MSGGIPAQFSSQASDDSGSISAFGLDGFPLEDLTLHLELLYTSNHELTAALSRVEAAVIRAELAGADLLPGINASLGANKARQNFIGLPIPGSTGPLTARFESYNLSLTSQWELDIWGRLRYARDAAQSSASAAGADLDWVQRSLLSSYLQLWTNAKIANRLNAIDQSIANNRKELLQVQEARFRQGLLNGDTLITARSGEKSALLTLVESSRTKRDALRNIEKLLAQYPSGTIDLPGSIPDDLPSLNPGIPSSVLEARPDVKSARLRLEAASHNVARAKADLFPRIALTASGGTSSDQLSDLTDMDFSVWSLGGNIARPILDYGKLKNLVNLSRSSEREALANYYSMVQNALSEVESGLDYEQSIRTALDLAHQNFQRSRHLLDSVKAQYSAGVTSIHSVLETQYVLMLEEKQLLVLQRQLLLNRIALVTSLGLTTPDIHSDHLSHSP